MFKRITAYDYTVTPYKANKRYVVDKTNDWVSNYLGVKYPDNIPFYEDEAPRNYIDEFEGAHYKTIYELIDHFYYRSDEPFQRFGIENTDEVDLSGFPTEDYSSIGVIKVSNQLFGERILPESLTITFTLPNKSFNLTITDDGSGNLKLEDNDNVVGNVFYRNGVLTFFWDQFYDSIDDSAQFPNYPFDSDDETFEETGFLNFAAPNFEYLLEIFNYELDFRGEITNYEHEVSCTANPHEFNGVTNPTVKKDDDSYIDYFKGVATDPSGDTIEFSPFVTTIGLYDEFLNLVAVGKLSRPIQKPRDIPITFIVRFDT